MLKNNTNLDNLKYNQCGMALPLVLIISSVLLAFSAALFNYSLNEKIISRYYRQDVIKYHLAEAGLEAGYAVLQKDFHYQGVITEHLADGCFIVQFIDITAEKRLIVAEGKLEDYSLTLKMLVENDPASGPLIIEWLGE